MNGKGSRQRPRSPGVTDEEWAEKWKRIFRSVRDERLGHRPLAEEVEFTADDLQAIERQLTNREGGDA